MATLEITIIAMLGIIMAFTILDFVTILKGFRTMGVTFTQLQNDITKMATDANSALTSVKSLITLVAQGAQVTPNQIAQADAAINAIDATLQSIISASTAAQTPPAPAPTPAPTTTP